MLLQGDELAVQLFIGAAALTALSVAMTQAGWTHKWFVRSMFGLATVLAMASVGWPFFEARIPLISEWLQTITSSRVVWFFMGIGPALVTGLLFGDAIRRKRERPEKWMSIFLAMENQGRQDLLDRYHYVIAQAENAFDRLEELRPRIAELEGALVFAAESERASIVDALMGLNAEYAVFKREREKWKVTVQDCEEALRTNIHSQLQTGELIAKGFLAPHTAGQEEKIIPKGEWRVLSLDEQGDQALGPNFEYIALLISKPRR